MKTIWKSATGMTMKKNYLNKGLEILQFNRLDDCNIFHFVTTRRGGVSQGTYSTFNLGRNSGDTVESIQKNYEILSENTGISLQNIVYPCQQHTVHIRKVDSSFLGIAPIEREKKLVGIDALVTDIPDVCIVVTTADCVPVLLYAPDKKVVAAVHAGWRGTVGCIAANCVKMMVSEYGCDPKVMRAGIGPSISQSAFEVGEELVEAFRKFGQEKLSLLVERHPVTGKNHIDLWKANSLQLQGEGLVSANIEVAGMCTFSNEELFFSARRQGIKCGRMLSGIMLK